LSRDSVVSEKLRQSDGPAVGKLSELGAAREAVGQHDCVGVGCHGW